VNAEGRYWLRLQLVMAVAGGAIWYAGVLMDSGFASGMGVGILLSALCLRLVRLRADRGA
jgi:hypothetical protein